jgi:hypothetical protein
MFDPLAKRATFCEASTGSTPYTFDKIVFASKRTSGDVSQGYVRNNCSQAACAGCPCRRPYTRIDVSSTRSDGRLEEEVIPGHLGDLGVAARIGWLNDELCRENLVPGCSRARTNQDSFGRARQYDLSLQPKAFGPFGRKLNPEIRLDWDRLYRAHDWGHERVLVDISLGCGLSLRYRTASEFPPPSLGAIEPDGPIVHGLAALIEIFGRRSKLVQQRRSSRVGAECLSPFSVGKPGQYLFRQGHRGTNDEGKRGLAHGPLRLIDHLNRATWAGCLSPFSVGKPGQHLFRQGHRRTDGEGKRGLAHGPHVMRGNLVNRCGPCACPHFPWASLVSTSFGKASTAQTAEENGDWLTAHSAYLIT